MPLGDNRHLDIDRETTVTWNRHTGEIVSIHAACGGDQPAGVALDRLRRRFAENAAELRTLQQAAEALMRVRVKEPGCITPATEDDTDDRF
jgi:hypothetical protein